MPMKAFNLNEKPKYKVRDDVTVISATSHVPGAIVPYDGWPKPHELVPLNEAARRIAAYYAKNHMQPRMPQGPWCPLISAFYLPAAFGPSCPPNWQGDDGWRMPSPVKPEDAADDMPRWRASRDRKLGSRELKTGEEFVYLGWPLDDFFEPVNEFARIVLAYFAANRENGALLQSPWCAFRKGLVLPQLPGTLATEHDRAIRAEIEAIAGKKPTGIPTTYPSGATTGVNRPAPAEG